MCLHCDCLTRGLLFQFQLALTVAWATPVTPMDMVTIVSTVSPGFFKSTSTTPPGAPRTAPTARYRPVD